MMSWIKELEAESARLKKIHAEERLNVEVVVAAEEMDRATEKDWLIPPFGGGGHTCLVQCEYRRPGQDEREAPREVQLTG